MLKKRKTVDPRDVRLAEVIKKRRADLDLSQLDIAKQIGLSRQGYDQLEKNKTRIGCVRLIDIAKALETTHLELLAEAFPADN